MKIKELILNFKLAGKRVIQLGNEESGVLIALDMEGRIFTYLRGEVLNRVNLDAVAGFSTLDNYKNPGGDGLWPAPEGTNRGFQYVTGNWRVPAGIRSARYHLLDKSESSAIVEAEIDLINNEGLGFPTVFRRDVRIKEEPGVFELHILETIKYLGAKYIEEGSFLMAPWSLCQFDCAPGCSVQFPAKSTDLIYDLYEEKAAHLARWDGELCSIDVAGDRRFQLGLAPDIPWIEFYDANRNLRVKRDALLNSSAFRYFDISDTNPKVPPRDIEVRYSIYADPNGFMEIEAVGGSAKEWIKGNVVSLTTNTTYYY